MILDAYSAKQIHLTWVEGANPVIPPPIKDMLEFTFDHLTYKREIIDYGLGDGKHYPFIKKTLGIIIGCSVS